MPIPCDPQTAIDQRIDKGADGCWHWTGTLTVKGYGQVFVNGRLHRAHRLAYETYVGAIPEGLQLDHLCRNRACVNPDHLEPVTSRENTMRSPISITALNATKTHCKRGHEFTPENTRVSERGDRRGQAMRTCRTCDRNRKQARAFRAAGIETAA